MRISRTFITKSVLQIFFFNQNAIWIQNHATDAGYVAQASITIQVIKKQSQQEESFLKNWRKINIENQQIAKASNENEDDDSGSSWQLGTSLAETLSNNRHSNHKSKSWVKSSLPQFWIHFYIKFTQRKEIEHQKIKD